MSTIQQPSEIESLRDQYAERHRELMQELAANPPTVDDFDFDPTQVPVVRMGILGLVLFVIVGIAAFLGTRLGTNQTGIIVHPKPELHHTTLPVVNEGGRQRFEGEQSFAVRIPIGLTVYPGEDIYVKVKLSAAQLKRLKPQIQEGLFFPPREIELSDEQLRLLLKRDEIQQESPPSH